MIVEKITDFMLSCCNISEAQGGNEKIWYIWGYVWLQNSMMLGVVNG